MREIKFRAWDKVREEWIYSDEYPSMWSYFRELEFRGIRHFESYQYTGLKDKNGKEIYEGDILQTQGTEPICGEVTWEDDGCWDCMGFNGHRIKYLNFEVIGNIYENKELLEV